MSSPSFLRAQHDSSVKGPWWLLFTSVSKVRYLKDNTHSSAWCNACVDRFVREQEQADRENFLEGVISEVRSIEDLRKIGASRRRVILS